MKMNVKEISVMPLVRVDIVKGKSVSYKKEMLVRADEWLNKYKATIRLRMYRINRGLNNDYSLWG